MPRTLMLVSLSLLVTATPVAAAPGSVADAAPAADPVLAAQILLDRARHSPGVIDGRTGSNTRRAISTFERVNGLPVDGEVDAQLMATLRSADGEPPLQDYQIAHEDVSSLVQVPEGMSAQAKLERLGYETAVEALAERFHMSRGLLKRLNPEARFIPGETIRVVKPGNNKLAATVARIEVEKGAAELRAYSVDGTLLASYPATIGSSTFPSPTGTMTVRAVAPSPKYYFDPADRSWGPDQKLTIAAGPNNPVGTTWIDLSKDGYGIHGTPEPRLIGKTASHGCVRLTNWDAAELAQAVEKGATVTFLERAPS